MGKGGAHMKLGKLRVGVTDILLLALNASFFIGIQTVFSPCEPHPDGTWMTCHWAGEALAGIAAVLVGIAVLHLLIPSAKIKQGLALASIPVSLLAMYLPGHLVDLCMKETMRCHTLMQPAVMAISALTVLLAVVDIYVYGRRD